MEQKHFIDIENLREFEVDLGNGAKRPSNAQGFIPGDRIIIQEKVDGSNASFAYDKETNSLIAFSRKQRLDFNKTLNGFWNFVQSLNVNEFQNENLVIFGEWTGAKNKIVYDKDKTGIWYVFDIYDKEKMNWKTQDFVKNFCTEHSLTYINTLYDGPFISWEHCRTFSHNPHYGARQEGIVVKDQDRLLDENSRVPAYLKVVNEDFRETKTQKIVDPEKEEKKNQALSLVESIVTRQRVEKILFKLRDEGIISDTVEPKDMKTIAQNLPRRVYEDCVKEEPEIVKACGEFGSKLIPSTAMKIAREIILG